MGIIKSVMKAVSLTCLSIGALTEPGHTSRLIVLFAVGLTLGIMPYIHDGIEEERRAYAQRKRCRDRRNP